MNHQIEHPSAILTTDVADTLRETAHEAEQKRGLAEEQLATIYRQQWFRMYVPREFGGPGLSLTEILKIEEAVAWADGSTAWVVTLCSGAGWFIGFLNRELAKEIFIDEKVCLAGSGSVTGVATRNANGFEITGSWKYASGALHATDFTANCFVKDENGKLLNENGSPMVLSFVFKRNEVTIKEAWHSMGMVATASHAFEINGLQVPEKRSFKIDPAYATLPDPIFRFPFLQLAETTLAVNMSGMAIRFSELCEDIFKRKSLDNTYLLERQNNLDALRHMFFSQVHAAWDTLIHHQQISKGALSQLSDSSHALVRYSRALVNNLFPLCGLEAADTRTEINRVWRNFNTAGQHMLFQRNS